MELDIIKAFEDIDHIDSIKSFYAMINNNCKSFERYNLLTTPIASCTIFSDIKKQLDLIVVFEINEQYDELLTLIPKEIYCVIILLKDKYCKNESELLKLLKLGMNSINICKMIVCIPSHNGGYDINRNYKLFKNIEPSKICITI